MPKKNSDGRSTKNLPKAREPKPPLLSEMLIAQLQGAVNAAQRKRMTKPVDACKSRSDEKDF